MASDEIRRIVQEELARPILRTIRDADGLPIGLRSVATGEVVYLSREPEDATLLRPRDAKDERDHVFKPVFSSSFEESVEHLRISLETVAQELLEFREEASMTPLVNEGWHFDAWADRVAELPSGLPESAWPPSGWTLYRDGSLEVVYAPFDWTNEQARVALVGITPGRHQGWVGSMEAASALREGASHEDALRRANSVASFSGPMRRNLVAMLDGIGLADQLGIVSCGELFGAKHDLATHLSALAFPVFVNGRNYGGAGITRRPALVAIIRQVLAGQLTQAKDALVVPLGNAATAAVGLLIGDGVVKADRCLLGFPHPSGANGHRKAQFDARIVALSEAVATWGG
jgi:hypothetical protein